MLTLTAVLAILAACQTPFQQKRAPISVGIPWLEQNALIFTAEEQGLFASNGLEVTLKQYDSGPAALDALVKEQVDIAGTAEYPFVRAVFQNQPVRILASIDRFENDLVLARKDRGIQTIADLKGKRIGLARQTINEFYLGRLLQLNQIAAQDVTLVDLKPAEFQPAIVNGQVDALIAWQPYIHNIQHALPGVETWPAQSGQLVYGLLVGREGWLAAHPGEAASFLKALNQAEAYLIEHPDSVKATVQKRLGYDQAYIDAVWPDHQFSLTLDHSLIVAMMDEARWTISSGLVNAAQPPDFIKTIYLNGMNTVKPKAVEITP